MNSPDKTKRKKHNVGFHRITISVFGILLNLLLSFFMYKLGLPLYCDIVGTVLVAVITELLFPAICTAVCTSLLCSFFYWPAIYLAFINAFIAIITVAFARKNSFRRVTRNLLYIIVITILSAASVTILQYVLYGQSDKYLAAKNALAFSSAAALPFLPAFCVTNLVLYFLQNGFICILIQILKGHYIH